MNWAENSDDIMAEYKSWTEKIKLLDTEKRAVMNSSDEWRKSKDVYPHIYNAARWHCAISTSSVACERVFAIMRKMEASDRLTMEEDSFQFELFFKCNQWIVDTCWSASSTACPCRQRRRRLRRRRSTECNTLRSKFASRVRFDVFGLNVAKTRPRLSGARGLRRPSSP